MTRTGTARRLLVAAVATTLGLGVTAGLGASPAGAGSLAQVATGGMVAEVNQARAARGVPRLTTSGELASVALAQARRMAQQRRLHHNPNLTREVRGYRWVGENVGYGPSLSVIQDAFMRSPSHRANILDRDFTQVGVAAVRDDRGRTWVAQVFRRPLGATTGPAPRRSTGKAGSSTRSRRATTRDGEAAKRQTRSRTRSGDAVAAPERTARPTAPGTPRRTEQKARPSRTVRPPRPRGDATPTLAARVAAASRTPVPGDDPVADTFAFAEAMRTVGG